MSAIVKYLFKKIHIAKVDGGSDPEKIDLVVGRNDPFRVGGISYNRDCLAGCQYTLKRSLYDDLKKSYHRWVREENARYSGVIMGEQDCKGRIETVKVRRRLTYKYMGHYFIDLPKIGLTHFKTGMRAPLHTLIGVSLGQLDRAVGMQKALNVVPENIKPLPIQEYSI